MREAPHAATQPQPCHRRSVRVRFTGRCPGHQVHGPSWTQVWCVNKSVAQRKHAACVEGSYACLHSHRKKNTPEKPIPQ